MKKWIAAFTALMMLMACAAFAEGTANDSAEEAKALFDSEWVCEGKGLMNIYYNDGYWKAEAYSSDGTVQWDYICIYDPAEKALFTDPNSKSTKTVVTFDEDGAVGEETVMYQDGDAAFFINDKGMLIWKDKKENTGDGFEYRKIGWFEGDYASDDYIMNIAWDAGEEETGEPAFCYRIMITKKEGQSITTWNYSADYLAESNKLVSFTGSREFKANDEDEAFEIQSEDLSGEFTMDEQGAVHWKDAQEKDSEQQSFVRTNG